LATGDGVLAGDLAGGGWPEVVAGVGGSVGSLQEKKERKRKIGEKRRRKERKGKEKEKEKG